MAHIFQIFIAYKHYVIKAEKCLFSGLIIAGVFRVAYQVVEGMHFHDALFSFLRLILYVYIPVALIALILYCLYCFISPLRLWLYYYVWISRVYGKLKKIPTSSDLSSYILNKFFNEPYTGFVQQSFSKQLDLPKERKPFDVLDRMAAFKDRPVFVRKEDLMEKGYWHNWAFAEVLLFGQLQMQRTQTKNVHLKVDLRKQDYGIYNNAGKVFLRNTYLNNPNNIRNCFRTSQNTHNYLKSKNNLKPATINADKIPFRWASGGILPIAKWKDKCWYVLIYRDIPPVGWNLPLGASETESEYHDLCRISYREFLEELILLNSEPSLSQNDGAEIITQRRFHFPAMPEKTHKMIDKMHTRFTDKHIQLRKDHDRLHLKPGVGPTVRCIRTPFVIEVTYYDAKREVLSCVEDVIITINPTEFGIESLHAVCFDMNDNDYLMCGEIWEPGRCLIRQPVMLLSSDYVRDIYEQTGTLGVHMKSHPHLDCKYLEKIPPTKYKIFDKDVEFLKKRLDHLENIGRSNSREAKRYKHRLKHFLGLFPGINNPDTINSKKCIPLRTLCPVTWKAMELMCHYDLISKSKAPC